MIPQKNPTIKPTITSIKVCCPRIILLVPKSPVRIIKKLSHDIGLKVKMKLYESNPPTIIPLLATCVLIFHLKLIIVEIIIQISVATIISERYLGKWILLIVIRQAT